MIWTTLFPALLREKGMKRDLWRRAVAGMSALAASSFACGEPQDPADKGSLAFAAIYALESRENVREAVKAYVSAANGGSCQAAKRLGEIYDRRLIGISQDYAE